MKIKPTIPDKKTGREGGNLMAHVSKCIQGKFLLDLRITETGT